MKHIIVGTAGHIDHGKTALVRALTGIDTDRLAEEKKRGISIDLGFAHWDVTPHVRLGFVDVPGHERFVKNMLAGAGGIDLVLFVIAADESIKPQTREHFDICRLLGVRHGIVVLTKADLVDSDVIDLVKLEVEEFTAGSFLAGAPVVAVSSTTGRGLDELRTALAGAAARVQAKDASRHFRLPLDRAFSMRGFGTVVTGTLISGSVTCEQEVEAHPGGRRLRVRGIQVHGQAAERALAGQRTALNVSGAEPAELRRGMMLAEPGRFRSTQRIDCRLHLLASAKPLKHRAPVHFHAATAEVEAEVRLWETKDAMKPGTSGLVRLLLRDPLLLLPGDRFILRMFSPVVTIAGGVVLDAQPPGQIRKEASLRRLRVLEGDTTAARLQLLVREAPFGMAVEDLISRTALLAAEVEAAAEAAGLEILRAGTTWLVDRQWARNTAARLETLAGDFHRANPLLPGMSKQELRSRELPSAPPFLLDGLIARSAHLVADGEIVRLKTHSLALRQEEQQALARIEQAFLEGGLAVPAWQEVLSRCGVEAARARALLQILLRERKLVRVSDDLLYHQSALLQLRQLLAHRKGARFTVPEFKDWTGVSRKYAIPLLEYLDRERITRRQGDQRLVL